MTPDEFLEKWAHCYGNERANYSGFLGDFATMLGVPTPGPGGDDGTLGDHQAEGPVPEAGRGGGTGFIDLYKRGCFVLEAKQSQIKKGPQPPPGGDEQLALLDPPEDAPRAASGAKYDRLMADAYRQAKNYVVHLPSDHPWPPFVIVLDVGRAFELYFDKAGNGRGYDFFPDRLNYRIPIEKLADEDTQALFRTIWTSPRDLDPRLETVEVSRGIARRLADVSAWLEATQRAKSPDANDAERSRQVEETSLFLLRILFCMFAEDIGLLPKEAFQKFLERTLDSDAGFKNGLEDLWKNMGAPHREDRWAHAVNDHVRYFNGTLFQDAKFYVLSRENRGELLEAAKRDWKKVEPAIFGTFLEQALTAKQRAKLGAHYTPRPYVEMIVNWTIMDVLNAEWEAVEEEVAELSNADTLPRLTAFHDRLAAVRVLDPACGTGNFLYVAMEALLRLEAKVIEREQQRGLEDALSRVGPAQFFGLEWNANAAKIAELVLWIGWLRWQHGNDPDSIAEPVLGQKANINFGRHGGYDAVLALDHAGNPDLANPRRPDWPEVEFIVGNPPFIAGKDLKEELGQDYTDALRKSDTDVPPSADLVMHWWDHAAELAKEDGTALRRFGFVTTNSVTQEFSRRVVARHLSADPPLSLVMACPDHPWYKGAEGTAAVRIAMTVAELGTRDGTLLEVEHEAALDTDAPVIDYALATGRVHTRLGLGADPSKADPLLANEGLASRGVQLMGGGFKVSRTEAEQLGLGRVEGLERHVRAYRNNKDVSSRPPHAVADKMVVDLYGLTEPEVRGRFPEVYQHVYARVWDYKAFNKKTKREEPAGRKYNPRDSYRKKWWVFGEPRGDLRPALEGLDRYIVTGETSKHRVFQFLPIEVLPDNMLVAIASDDGFHLGVLSSRIHVRWALKAGGWMGVGNDPRYSKSNVFDPFPFPDATPDQREEIGALAEELDGTRREALDAPADLLGGPRTLTMTGLYNLRERIAAGETLGDEDHAKAVDARAYIVHRLHEQIDEAVARAYGWPPALAPAEIVARLVALNAQRVAEEQAGEVRWLRPDYQESRFGKQG